MILERIRGNSTASVLGALLLASCSGSPTQPDVAAVAFSLAQLDLGTVRVGTVTVENTGTLAIGPVELVAGPVRDQGGSTLPGAEVRVTPPEIPTLNPGGSAQIELDVVLPGTAQPGMYDVVLEARAGVDATAVLEIRMEVEDVVDATGPARVEIAAGNEVIRQGDVISYSAQVRDDSGQAVSGVPVSWSVIPMGSGIFGGNGQFVAYSSGQVRIVAHAGTSADTILVTVHDRGLTGSIQEIGRAEVSSRFTSDLWLHGDHAYTGTWGIRALSGDVLYTWSLADPNSPVLSDSLRVDARTVNDVKVRADGRIGMLTHEGGQNGNGVTLLDLEEPGHPQAITRFTTGLENGVHNVWIEGDYAYLVVDGVGSGLRVMDISDPADPRIVASFYGGESFLHDVYVRDGLAFLSHWNAGLIILDVGNGIAGGSPASPVEVSRIKTVGGQTHNAWYWPAAGYVFVGEEDFATPGLMHVVDVRNLAAPREVATFRVEGSTPHNFWLDEDTGVLYMAWYANGLRAVDVTGELLGELDRQGREIAFARYGPNGFNCSRQVGGTCSWAPQLHRGRVYVSDMDTGLLVLQPSF